MTHPEDISPYRSREDLFETIRRQRIDIDNLQDENMKLRALFDQVSEHVVMETEEDYPIG